MLVELKFLKDFYSPIHKKTFKANSVLKIDVDADGTPIHSFWFEQLRFEENKSYFEIQTLSTTKKPK